MKSSARPPGVETLTGGPKYYAKSHDVPNIFSLNCNLKLPFDHSLAAGMGLIFGSQKRRGQVKEFWIGEILKRRNSSGPRGEMVDDERGERERDVVRNAGNSLASCRVSSQNSARYTCWFQIEGV